MKNSMKLAKFFYSKAIWEISQEGLRDLKCRCAFEPFSFIRTVANVFSSNSEAGRNMGGQ